MLISIFFIYVSQVSALFQIVLVKGRAGVEFILTPAYLILTYLHLSKL